MHTYSEPLRKVFRWVYIRYKSGNTNHISCWITLGIGEHFLFFYFFWSYVDIMLPKHLEMKGNVHTYSITVFRLFLFLKSSTQSSRQTSSPHIHNLYINIKHSLVKSNAVQSTENLLTFYCFLSAANH